MRLLNAIRPQIVTIERPFAYVCHFSFGAESFIN